MTTYTPQVGDRVKSDIWPDEGAFDVIAVTDRWLVGVHVNNASGRQYGDAPVPYLIDERRWVKVTPRPELPTMPDVWSPIGQRKDGTTYCTGVCFQTAEHAMECDEAVGAVRYTATTDVVWADEVER